MIAYLSGAMENVADEGAGWRDELTDWLRDNLGHSVIDPVVTSQQLVDENDADGFRQWKMDDPDRFVEFVRKAVDLDLDNVMNQSDYIICLWNRDVMKGGGTHGEVTMAYHAKIPVYLVCEMPNEDLSGWIMSCSTHIFNHFSELKSYLIETYNYQ